jgi:PiT family inorganic phosphate transporter
MGAISWNAITWYFGLPSSSSHALIGGLIGAGVAKVGFGGLVASGIGKTVLFIFVSPIMGFVLGGLLLVAVSWMFRRTSPSRIDRWFRRMQLVSAAAYSLGHGGNDAQKTIGIIWVLLIGARVIGPEDGVPTWTIIACYVAIALGTFFGGWRIVKTMGHSLTKLAPIGGFAAETGGGVTIIFLAKLGIPVSTTHTITGAIVGVGATKGWRAVKWGVAGRILWAWVFTIPASALMAVLVYWLSRLVVMAVQ